MKQKFNHLIFIILLIKLTTVASAAPTIFNYTTTINSGTYDGIIVSDGATLTIQGTIYIEAGKKITINNYARVIVDGALITETNNDGSQFWEGFEVFGRKLESTHPTYDDVISGVYNASNGHGILILKNDAEIRYANTAVLVGKYFHPLDAFGAVFTADNCNFMKCKRSIVFNGRKGLFSRIYKINNCTFNNDNISSVTSDDFYISANNTEFVEINNCHFYGSIGGGIDNKFGTVRVNNSNFHNMHIGISITNFTHNRYPNGIYQNLFENVDLPIKINSTARVGLHENIINLNQNKNYDFSGIYLDGCVGYNINFNSINGIGSYVSGGDLYRGLYISNSGPNGHVVYKNTFDNITTGFQSSLNNIGLQLKCNTFQNVNNYDWAISSNPGMPNQGNLSMPSGNLFSQICNMPTSDLHLNPGVNSLEYFYDIRPKSKPQCFTNSSVNLINTNLSFNCLPFNNPNNGQLQSWINENLQSISNAPEPPDDDGLIESLIKENEFIKFRILQNYLDSFKLDSAILFLENDTTNFSLTQLIPLYIETGDLNKAIIGISNFNDNGNSEYQAFSAYYEIIIYLAQVEYNFDSLNSSHWETLNLIASGETVYATSAKVLLNYFNEEDFELLVYEDIVANNSRSEALKVNKNQIESLFLIYPNPSKDNLNIELQNFTNQNFTIKIVDIQGRVLVKDSMTKSNYKLDVSTINNGLYFCVIQNNDSTILTQKFIISK
ncbi:MAG: T9SS type A sorting domain-containing protein [Bacteroidota bacterium]|nr:T9SS type A sorting domain-containing protein [Bacteroidota bacterium]